MTFALKHNITGVALRDLLALINVIVPGALPSSCYLFKKLFDDSAIRASAMYYCNACGDFVGSHVSEICKACNIRLNEKELTNKGSYFISISLSDQLKQFLENHNLIDFTLQRRFNYESTGLSEFLSCRDNISLACNIDGVPVFNSSSVAIWPVFVAVNELPVNKRSDFLLLHSLWFGNSKPKMDVYLQPFVSELQNLYDNGVQWIDANGCKRLTKCVLTLCVCDSVARPFVQNTKQFNGLNGCGYCLHEGKSVKKGRGHVRVYPIKGSLSELRHCAATKQHALLATNQNKPVLGVKGQCMFSNLPFFDTVMGFAPDYMHGVCLGVVKQVIELTMSRSSHGKEFYLGDRETDINRFMLAQVPPNEIRRLPRSFKYRKFFKAAEWRSFLLFYSPLVFQNVMKVQYFHNWLLLVFLVFIYYCRRT
jgi:hypothetical protein